MLTYGFFDSKNKDRTYNAEQMSSLFAGIITDGIFANYPAEGQQMVIQGSSNTSDLGKVFVGPGRGWFNNVWVDNDSLFEIQLDAPDASNPRRDAIVIEIHKHAEGDYCRSARIVFKKGTPAASPSTPSVSHDAAHGIYRYRIGWVQVPAGATAVHYTVSDSRIHNTVGVSGGVPFIIGAVNSVTAQNVLDGWHDAVNQQVAAQISAYLDNQSSYLYTFLANRFDSIDAFLDNPSDHFRKIFYYHESPTTIGTPPYHGELNSVIGRTSSIVSDTSNGGIGGLYPRNATVKQGDILIGRSGTVAQIYSISRNEDTGYILSISVSTIGNVQGDLQAQFDNYKVSNDLAHSMMNTILSQLQSDVTDLSYDVQGFRSAFDYVNADITKLNRVHRVFTYGKEFSDEVPSDEEIVFSDFSHLQPDITELWYSTDKYPEYRDVVISKNGIVGVVQSATYIGTPTTGLQGGDIWVTTVFSIEPTETPSAKPPLYMNFTFQENVDQSTNSISYRPFCNKTFAEAVTADLNGRELIGYWFKWDRSVNPSVYRKLPGKLVKTYRTIDANDLIEISFEFKDIEFNGSTNPSDWNWTIYKWVYTSSDLTITADIN